MLKSSKNKRNNIIKHTNRGFFFPNLNLFFDIENFTNVIDLYNKYFFAFSIIKNLSIKVDNKYS